MLKGFTVLFKPYFLTFLVWLGECIHITFLFPCCRRGKLLVKQRGEGGRESGREGKGENEGEERKRRGKGVRSWGREMYAGWEEEVYMWGVEERRQVWEVKEEGVWGGRELMCEREGEEGRERDRCWGKVSKRSQWSVFKVCCVTCFTCACC